MAVRKTRAERKQETRRRLLDAAADVFARRGFHGASVEEIAAQAGFTQGALYANFAGKEGLFLAAIDDRMAAQAAEVADRIDDDHGDDALREHAERQFQQQLDNDFVDLLLLLEFLLHAVRHRHDLRQALEQRYRAADAFMAEEVHRRRQRPDDGLALSDEEVGVAHGAMLHGLALRMLLNPDAWTPQHAASLLERAIRGAAST